MSFEPVKSPESNEERKTFQDIPLTRGARQEHGFIYEDKIIKKYNLTKEINYTGKFDGFCPDGTPVQIKYMGYNNEICMSSWRRNMEIDKDFILHIGFYKESNGVKTHHSDYTIFINVLEYRNMFYIENYEEIEAEFKLMKSRDERYKLFSDKNKKIRTGDIVKIRFKRHSKSPNRIQGAIPFKKFSQFREKFKLVNFSDYELKECPKTVIMTYQAPLFNVEQRKTLEKFYTNPKAVDLCMINLKDIIPDDVHYLEPSAGGGAFVNRFGENTYNAYDIEPESKDVVKQDFLKIPLNEIISLENNKKPLITIGNPPYKLAIEFINRCAELTPAPIIIAFVLPNVFKKPTVFNRIDLNYHLKSYNALPKNSFELGSDNYNVPSGFFVLERRNTHRTIIGLNVEPIGFKFIPFSKITINEKIILGADISIIRVGGRAGTAFSANDVSENGAVSKQKYNYFIKIDPKFNIFQVIEEINKIKWESNNTTGPKSIGKYELTPRINLILESI